MTAYSIEELTRAAKCPVDTIRYYQTLGLLQPPAHEGRRAVYDTAHLDRLKLIRAMSRRGLPLRVIRMLITRGAAPLASDQALLSAIEDESEEPSYSSSELASELGIPHALLVSIERAGLAEAQEQGDGRTRYSESDLKAARGALRLLGFGFPLHRLIVLAVKHDRGTRRTVDEAIELFDRYVRKRQGGALADDGGGVAEAFKTLLPVVTGLVAHHFQRLLVNRALKRLRKKGDRGALAAAVEVTSKTRIGVGWR
jgi:DNA-binding transcriptional MerR regulator